MRIRRCGFTANERLFTCTLDPDFEVPFLIIHAVKIYEKSVGCAVLGSSYGILGMSENIQDFWQWPEIRKSGMPKLFENPLMDL